MTKFYIVKFSQVGTRNYVYTGNTMKYSLDASKAKYFYTLESARRTMKAIADYDSDELLSIEKVETATDDLAQYLTNHTR